jgi:hypothetical protein
MGIPWYGRFTDGALESSTGAVLTSPRTFSTGKVTPRAGNAFGEQLASSNARSRSALSTRAMKAKVSSSFTS